MKFFKDVLFIFLLAFFFAGITAGANLMLSRRIALNDQTRNSRYLLEVLGIPFPRGEDAAELDRIEGERVARAKLDGNDVYRSFDQKGTPSEYAFKIGGKGFWGRIDGLLALNKDLNRIEGIVFTRNVETPGLGARIEEKWFRDQFRGIELPDKPKKGKYVIVSKQEAGAKNRVDAITGATRTSSMVENFLNEDIGRILAQKDEIRRIDWPSPQKR